MDKDALLEYFDNFFKTEEEQGGLNVAAYYLVPAYGDAVSNSFVLCVSSPSLNGKGCDDKTDAVISLLYRKADPEPRITIDRVRVYNSTDELRRHSQSKFDQRYGSYCEMRIINDDVPSHYAAC